MKEIILDEVIPSIHRKNISNLYYLEGFNSASEENPYKLDVELNLKVIRISQREPFTKEDGQELEKERTLLENSPYCSWSMGNYIRREYPFLLTDK